jgi:hypothetical protein
VTGNVESALDERRIGVRYPKWSSGGAVEGARPVQVRRVEENVERSGLFPAESDGAIGENGVEEGGDHAEESADAK